MERGRGRWGGMPPGRSVRSGRACRLHHGCAGNRRGEPRRKVDYTLELAALAQMRNDGRNQQAILVGMHVGINAEASGDSAGTDIGAAIDVYGAIGAKLSCLSCAIQVKTGDAL